MLFWHGLSRNCRSRQAPAAPRRVSSPQSHSTKFIDLLARAVSYTFKDDNLVINSAATAAPFHAPGAPTVT